MLQGWNFGVEGGRGGELHGYHHITFLKDSFTYVRIISLIKMLSFIKLSIPGNYNDFAHFKSAS